MMKMNLYFQIATIIILMLTSCEEKEDCHRSIEIVNNSSGDLWLAETGLQHNGLNCQQVPGLIPMGESYILDLRVCWEDRINKTYQGAVVFYFFDENYFLTHPECDSIEFNQSVIERKEFSVEDLNSLDWVIEYL
jgi:hypothetical protein